MPGSLARMRKGPRVSGPLPPPNPSSSLEFRPDRQELLADDASAGRPAGAACVGGGTGVGGRSVHAETCSGGAGLRGKSSAKQERRFRGWGQLAVSVPRCLGAHCRVGAQTWPQRPLAGAPCHLCEPRSRRESHSQAPRRAGAAAPLPEFARLHAGSLGGRWPRLRVRRHRRGDGMRATRGRGRERVVHRGRGAGGGGGRFAVTTRRLTRLCSNWLAGSSLCRPRTHPHVPATPAPTARPQGGPLVTKTRARLLVAVPWRHLEPPALRICATVPLSRESGLRFVPHLDEPAEGPTQERGRGAQNRKRPLSDPAAHSRGRPRSCAPFWKRGPESDASRLPPRHTTPPLTHSRALASAPAQDPHPSDRFIP